MHSTRSLRGGYDTFQVKKAKELILFFINESPSKRIGFVKLMSLIYFADFDHYEKYGKGITGAIWTKRDHGPYAEEIAKLIKKMSKPREALRAEDV